MARTNQKIRNIRFPVTDAPPLLEQLAQAAADASRACGCRVTVNGLVVRAVRELLRGEVTIETKTQEDKYA